LLALSVPVQSIHPFVSDHPPRMRAAEIQANPVRPVGASRERPSRSVARAQHYRFCRPRRTCCCVAASFPHVVKHSGRYLANGDVIFVKWPTTYTAFGIDMQAVAETDLIINRLSVISRRETILLFGIRITCLPAFSFINKRWSASFG
jgi:hypothetical protein